MNKTSDPIVRFAAVLEEARKTDLPEPTACVLATTSTDRRPSARVVLLKAFDSRGFVFYTNLGSRKAHELREVPAAALCFYWPPLNKQVRVEGSVELVSDAEADAYFATRPRGAQIAAWASRQSETLPGRGELEERVRDLEREYAGRDVPRPPFWSGYRLVPSQIEFWSSGEHRLHDRTLFTRTGDHWEIRKLYP